MNHSKNPFRGAGGDRINRNLRPVAFALLAAALYGVQVPFSKMLLATVDPLFLAGLLYLGAGTGMLAVDILERRKKAPRSEAPLSRKDLPYVILMILLDVAAPVAMLFGLRMASAGAASLLGNFEIAATALIAMLLFRESVGRRIWASILLITAACMILSAGDLSEVRMSPGALLVLLACVIWGLENNCTRKLSGKDPTAIVIVKGFGSGTGSLILALLFGKTGGSAAAVLPALLLGFASYGLSIYFYIRAQRFLGAARTSAYYAAAPFVGVLLSWAVLRERITWTFLLALALMIAGAALGVSEKHSHMHVHVRTEHEHMHAHGDGHHGHTHDTEVDGMHSHMHVHEEIRHSHPHTPDLHHGHAHEERHNHKQDGGENP